MRIFIHNVDTFLGQALFAELRKTEGGFHRIFGTVALDSQQAPSKVKRIVSREEPKKAKKMTETIQSCKLVIMDLFNSTLEDLHFAISSLKVDGKATPPKILGELDSEVIFVLISSIMVWAGTEPRPNGEALRDEDYARREPVRGSKYEKWKEMEELVMSCFNQEGSQVKGFVVAGGVLYGNGEETFCQLFKDAWCGAQEHQILEPGMNRIPTVHVRDLARVVRQLSVKAEELSPMEAPYLLAVDQPPERVKLQPPREPSPAPGDGAGGEETDAPGGEESPEGEQGEQGDEGEGEAEEGAEEDAPPAEEAEEEGKDADEPGGEEEEEEGEKEDPGPKTCPSTQAEIVQGIVDELSEHYDVPYVPTLTSAPDSSELRDAAEALLLDLNVAPSSLMLDEEFASESEPPGWWSREGILTNIRKVAGEFCQARKLRAIRVIIAGPPASGKTTLAQAVSDHFRIPLLELNPDAMESTVSQLSSNVCRYRGYVLDAGIVGREKVDQLFCYDAEVEPDEEEEEEEAEEDEENKGPAVKIERRVNTDLCPSFVIITQAPEALCRARWNHSRRGAVEEFARRFEEYSQANLVDGVNSLTDFFQDTARIGVLNLPIAGKDQEAMFESTRIYLEKAGRPFNYLPPEEQVAAEIRARRDEKDELTEEQKAMQLQRQLSNHTEQLEEAKTEARRLEIIAAHLEEHKKLRDIPLREYIMTHMVPTLTEGLIEMCRVLPDNPVDYLAAYIEEHAGT